MHLRFQRNPSTKKIMDGQATWYQRAALVDVIPEKADGSGSNIYRARGLDVKWTWRTSEDSGTRNWPRWTFMSPFNRVGDGFCNQLDHGTYRNWTEKRPKKMIKMSSVGMCNKRIQRGSFFKVDGETYKEILDQNALLPSPFHDHKISSRSSGLRIHIMSFYTCMQANVSDKRTLSR